MKPENIRIAAIELAKVGNIKNLSIGTDGACGYYYFTDKSGKEKKSYHTMRFSDDYHIARLQGYSTINPNIVCIFNVYKWQDGGYVRVI